MSDDDQLGISWWNSLTEKQREYWMEQAGNTGRAVDAWNAFRGADISKSHCGETDCAFQDGWCKCGMEG